MMFILYKSQEPLEVEGYGVRSMVSAELWEYDNKDDGNTPNNVDSVNSYNT